MNEYYGSYNDYANACLAHYGVLGMHWGVRKQEYESKNAKRKRIARNVGSAAVTAGLVGGAAYAGVKHKQFRKLASNAYKSMGSANATANKLENEARHLKVNASKLGNTGDYDHRANAVFKADNLRKFTSDEDILGGTRGFDNDVYKYYKNDLHEIADEVRKAKKSTKTTGKIQKQINQKESLASEYRKAAKDYSDVAYDASKSRSKSKKATAALSGVATGSIVYNTAAGTKEKKVKHFDDDPNYLAHYGVLGMHWGVRKDEASKAESRKRYLQKAAGSLAVAGAIGGGYLVSSKLKSKKAAKSISQSLDDFGPEVVSRKTGKKLTDEEVTELFKKRMTHEDEDPNYLAHYGVLGMHWGVRHTSYPIDGDSKKITGSEAASQKRRWGDGYKEYKAKKTASKEADRALIDKYKSKGESDDARMARLVKKKKIKAKNLSTQELQQVNNRLNANKQYRQLSNEDKAKVAAIVGSVVADQAVQKSGLPTWAKSVASGAKSAAKSINEQNKAWNASDAVADEDKISKSDMRREAATAAAGTIAGAVIGSAAKKKIASAALDTAKKAGKVALNKKLRTKK